MASRRPGPRAGLIAVAAVLAATEVARSQASPVAAAPAGAAAARESALDPAGTVTFDVSPQRARIGDPLAATLVVALPAGASIDPPPLDGRFGKFSVLSGGWSSPEPAGSGTRWTWTGVLGAYETGAIDIPVVAITVTSPAGSSQLKTEPVTIEIESVLSPAEDEAAPTSSADIADLKPPQTVPPDYRRLKVALGIVASLLAAAAIAWWLHRRYASRLTAVPAPEDPFRRVPPHQWAYEELQRLLERRLPESGQAELFFEELARILKRYLGGRYRINLMEQTTEDVAPLLAQAGAKATAVDEVRSLLARCDLVKFAKSPAASDACRAAMEEAYRVVDRTKPADAAAPAAVEGAA